MRQFAVAIVLMLLVAKVVIGQTHSSASEPKAGRMKTHLRPPLLPTDASTHGSPVGYKCYFYSYTKTGQGAVIMTNGDQGMGLGMELMRSIAHLYNWPDFKPIIKNMIRLSSEKLAAMVGNYTLHNRPGRVLQITAKENSLWVKQLWNNMEYTLCPESNLNFFVKEYGDRFTFESASDDSITGVIHGESKWIKMK
ncbi:hypothetical protein [Spirosoma gilvum]